ncbi:nucleoprotein/polynucleotide-associated enzyme [Marinobacterium lacunae]|uniref:Nucleoprotein/polynucleotide-associated enzyme n=1 Tax=Marinobacterium lacunae TaxID=1232683 RepID=A0A081FZV0_9GAMM|nr:DUF2058 domain-containing protein [Marinobacterium lacunae]KEA64055.1 nucleoprotein/polynucleotide-associated enzyme [Marinobacterium lacunae]
MAISLQDQLLKAGIANKQQAKKAKQEKKKEKKGQAPANNGDEQAALEAARKAKAERDRELNRQREAEQAQKAATAEVRQLLAQHAVRLPQNGETRYNFVHEKKVKSLWIDDSMLKQLAREQLLIAFFDGRYQIIPAEIGDRIDQRLTGVVLPRPEPEKTEEDDPYANYQIPDDLMW